MRNPSARQERTPLYLRRCRRKWTARRQRDHETCELGGRLYAEHARVRRHRGQRSVELLTCSRHPSGRIEEVELGGMHLMLYDERSVLDPPEALTGAQSWDEGLFRAGEAERG